jgi:uncharacterized membrane protein (DUF373 family)
MASSIEDRLRTSASQYSHVVEVVLYAVLGILLSIGAGATLLATCVTLWHGFREGTVLAEAYVVLEQLLLVLIFIEILHTVRISVRSQSLMMEPFLVVGLIASVRRVLVITMQAAKLVQEDQKGTRAGAELFRYSMIELGLLGFLILVFVISIYLVRRGEARTEESSLHNGCRMAGETRSFMGRFKSYPAAADELLLNATSSHYVETSAVAVAFMIVCGR